MIRLLISCSCIFTAFRLYSPPLMITVFDLIFYIEFFVCILLWVNTIFLLLSFLLALCVDYLLPILSLPVTVFISSFSFFSFFFFFGHTHGIWRFQARGLIQAVATGLHHSHSNMGSEPHLQPIPQFMATLDP